MMAGCADAVTVVGGRPMIVFDRKSEVSLSAADRQTYAEQLLEYMEAVGELPLRRHCERLSASEIDEVATVSVDLTPQEAMKRLEQHFGSREEMLTHTLTVLSMSGQPADITFYRRKPILNVRVSTKLGAARLYGLESRLPRLLRRIEFSNGVVAGLKEIWTVNPMPIEGFTQDELDAVDLAKGEDRVGPGGETLRKMIRKTYHCKNRSEVDYFLRRWIAS